MNKTATETPPEADPTPAAPEADFAQQAEEAPMGLVAEFVDFLLHNKKWWLIPIFLVMALLGTFVFLGGGAAAPFIYSLF